MKRFRAPLGIAAALALSATLACERSPVAPNEDNAEGVRFGRTNDNGARIWLPNYTHCAVVDGTGAFFVPVACTMNVATTSSNSNGTVVVQAAGVPNPTGKTVHWGPDNPGWNWAAFFYFQFGLTAPPYPCGVIDANGVVRLTLDWHAIVTPSGEATVTCHYSDRQAYQFPTG
jgi:hypothetical protein